MQQFKTVLRRAEYDSPEWGAVELSDDPTTHRAFWTAVLQFAVADHADAVYLRLDQGDDCLAVKVDGTSYSMIAPPPEYRKTLLQAATLLTSHSRVRAAVQGVVSFFDPLMPLGSIGVEVPGGIVEWAVFQLRDGIAIKRIAVDRQAS